MRTFTIRVLGPGLLALAVAAALMAPAGAASAQSSLNSTRLLTSTAPKQVVLDPDTGAVLAVYPLTERTMQALISNHNYCNTGDACYTTHTAPYANQGFYGTAGWSTGTWPYRDGGYTGNYYVQYCWVQGCSAGYFWPNTYTSFKNGQTVTGTGVGIHS